MAASNTFGSRFNDKAEDEKAIQQEELRLVQFSWSPLLCTLKCLNLTAAVFRDKRYIGF
jgi:hypothetical protein